MAEAPEYGSAGPEQFSGTSAAPHAIGATDQRPRRRARRATPLLASMTVLAVAGFATLGWAGIDYFNAGPPTTRALAAERALLRDTWPTPTPTPTPEPTPTPTATSAAPRAASTAGRTGSNTQTAYVARPSYAIGMMYIPSIGLTTPIMGDVDVESLKKGVGWFPGTALPGQVGNFPVAGHSVTYTEPFKYLQRVQPGDLVYVDYQGTRYTYQMETSPASLWVTDTTGGCVTDPIPCKYTGTHRTLITLITCALYTRTNQRAVGFGYLIDSKPIGA